MNIFLPLAFFDPPQVLNASVTNIPGSASLPLQVIADLGPKASYAIEYIDTTGDFIGVYTGDPGQEELFSIIGGGVTSTIYGVITCHSRVSLRSMSTSPITNGSIMCTFTGYP